MTEPIRFGDDLLMFTIRLIQNAIDEMTAAHWDRRALDFEDAISRPGDYPGRRSAEERKVADDKCRLIALCCRRHAALIRETKGELSPELLAIVDEVLGEVV